MYIGQFVTIRPAFSFTGEEADILGHCAGHVTEMVDNDVCVKLLGKIELDGYLTDEVWVTTRRIKVAA